MDAGCQGDPDPESTRAAFIRERVVSQINMSAYTEDTRLSSPNDAALRRRKSQMGDKENMISDDIFDNSGIVYTL